MSKTYKKELTAVNVFDAAMERFNTLYDRYDNVVVSFSGGKDSTVCLQLALMVATQRGKLPLDVVFFDEEAIHPTTIEYVERVAQMPGVRLHWYCIPVKHRNACSRQQPYWYCWNPDEKDLWVRDLPERAITQLSGFEFGMTMPDCAHFTVSPDSGMTAMVRGLRASESLRRYRSVSMKLEDNWIMRAVGGYCVPCSPIYDWGTEDVWIAPAMFGRDYNRTYDIFDQAGINRNLQRVCPPYGEEPLRGLHQYAVCFPELWAKMTKRVHGAATAARYGNSELYSVDVAEPPVGMTWRDYLDLVLDMNAPAEREKIREAINTMIRLHNKKSKLELHEDISDPISGFSWKQLCIVALRGDLKGRRKEQLTNKSTGTRNKLGITYEQALREDGNTRFF